MSDNLFLRNFRASACGLAPSGRRHVVPCAGSLMRYVFLGAVALSILPNSSASALAAIQPQTAQSQDQSNHQVDVPARINTSAFCGLLYKAGQLNAESAFDLNGTPVEVVYNNMTVSANGKQLAFNLAMSRADAGNLLLKQIPPN